MDVNLKLYDDDSNRYAVTELQELFKVIGIETKVVVDDGNLQFSFDYDSYVFKEKMKRNAGRRQKSTGKLTFGDVEVLLQTHSVKEIAQLAEISLPTCYRRIKKLKEYQEEELTGELTKFKGIYRGFEF